MLTDDDPFEPWQLALLWLVVCALSVETVVGNAMVILAYKLDRAISKQINNRYIVSLAISDLIIGVEGFPLFTVYVANGNTLSPALLFQSPCLT